MSGDWVRMAVFIAAIGSGMSGGLFFIFSNTIMKALARLPHGAGAAAMQSINTTIQNPAFLMVFFGTPAACLAVLIGMIPDLRAPGAAYAVSGALLHVLGTFIVTMVCNVPLNNALDKADVASPGGLELWRSYLVRWTRWNHVRTATSVAAAVLLTLTLIVTTRS